MTRYSHYSPGAYSILAIAVIYFLLLGAVLVANASPRMPPCSAGKPHTVCAYERAKDPAMAWIEGLPECDSKSVPIQPACYHHHWTKADCEAAARDEISRFGSTILRCSKP